MDCNISIEIQNKIFDIIRKRPTCTNNPIILYSITISKEYCTVNWGNVGNFNKQSTSFGIMTLFND